MEPEQRHKAAAVDGAEAEPACGEHTQKVPVGEAEHEALGLPDPHDEAVDALLDGERVLAAGGVRREDGPARHALADLLRREALEVAVIPLAQTGLDAGIVEAGETTGLPGPLHRARPDLHEVAAREPVSEGTGLFPAHFGEGDVGPARVPPRARPLGLAVADHDHARFGSHGRHTGIPGGVPWDR